MGRRIRVIGIAGPSGAGKTTVAAHLAGRGGVHVDADRIGHALLDGDPDVRRAVEAAFGRSVFGPDGRVDRRRLGRIVFADPVARARLDAIVHPAIRRECARRVEEAERCGAPFVVVDAALLLEVGMPFGYDLTIGLRVDRGERVRRLLGRGGRTREEIEARLDAQVSLERSLERADVVVDASRAIEDVLAEVDAHVDRLLGGGGETGGDP